MAFKILFIVAALCLLSLHADAFSLSSWFKTEPKPFGFSWHNCGPGSDPFQVKTLDLSPDPVRVPGNVTAGITFSIGAASPSDIGASVTMEKKVAGFWIKVPCEGKVGSCNYGNLCADWAAVCPKYFEKYGIPCTCLIAAGSYSIPDAIIDITKKLPSGASGQFRITGNVVSQAAGHLGCVQLDLNIS